MPRDPRGPEYGDASRLERFLTALLALGGAAVVALVALSLVMDVGGALDALGPAWVTVPLAVAIVVVIAILVGG